MFTHAFADSDLRLTTDARLVLTLETLSSVVAKDDEARAADLADAHGIPAGCVSEAENERELLRVDLLPALHLGRRGSPDLDVVVRSRLRSENAQRIILHVQGEPCTPHRQTEERLLVRASRRVELLLLGEEAVFHSERRFGAAFRLFVEVRELPCVYTELVTELREVLARAELRDRRARAEGSGCVKEIARTAVDVDGAIGIERDVELLVHCGLLS
jgi:hypothetical protein